MTRPLVVVDADALGRHRTGDETYVEQLLRALPAAAPDLRIAAVSRRPDLVPAGVEPIELSARSQELRMAVTLPRLLRRLRPALLHCVYSFPLNFPCPGVLTVHDLSFERDPSLMRPVDRLVFRTVVPRSARRAAAMLAISERTKADLVELYRLPPEKVTVSLLGFDRLYHPGPGSHDYLLFVGAIEPRKDPLVAARAAREVGLPLVVVGPVRDESLAAELRAGGADLRGYVTKEELAELYRGAACLIWSSRYEGFGLPVVEAMASGLPVAAVHERAVEEIAGDAALFAEPEQLGEAVRRAIAERDRLAAAGLARAQAFSWAETARLTASVYRKVLGLGS